MVYTYLHCYNCRHYPHQFDLENKKYKLTEPCFSCVQIVLWSKWKDAPKEIKEVGEQPAIIALSTQSQLLATTA